MSNVLQDALMRGLATDVITELPTEYPTLTGDVIALSDYGKTKWDAAISWTAIYLVANFINTQDAPYVPSNYGTVSIVQEPRPNVVPIQTEACKVEFNHVAYKKAERQGTLIDYYTAQLVAKVRAWDAAIHSVIMFGNPLLGTPGLLSGSGIPVINSSVNLGSATAEATITEFIRIAATPSVNSKKTFRPTKIAIPSDLWNTLNTRNYSANTTETLMEVIMQRLNLVDGYNKPSDPKFEVVGVPQFNESKLMTVLPSDPELIGACVFDLEEFDSPDGSEAWAGQYASAHEGGYAGVIAKQPGAGVLANLTY